MAVIKNFLLGKFAKNKFNENRLVFEDTPEAPAPTTAAPEDGDSTEKPEDKLKKQLFGEVAHEGDWIDCQTGLVGEWNKIAEADGHTAGFAGKVNDVITGLQEEFEKLKSFSSEEVEKFLKEMSDVVSEIEKIQAEEKAAMVKEYKEGEFETSKQAVLDKINGLDYGSLDGDLLKAVKNQVNLQLETDSLTENIQKSATDLDEAAKIVNFEEFTTKFNKTKDWMAQIPGRLDAHLIAPQKFIKTVIELSGNIEGITCIGDVCKAAKAKEIDSLKALFEKIEKGEISPSEVIAQGRAIKTRILVGKIKDAFPGGEHAEAIDLLLTNYNAGQTSKLANHQDKIKALVLAIKDKPEFADIKINLQGGADAIPPTANRDRSKYEKFAERAGRMLTNMPNDPVVQRNAALLQGIIDNIGDQAAWDKFVSDNEPALEDPDGPLNAIYAYARIEDGAGDGTGGSLMAVDGIEKSLYLETSAKGSDYRYMFTLDIAEKKAGSAAGAGTVPAEATATEPAPTPVEPAPPAATEEPVAPPVEAPAPTEPAPAEPAAEPSLVPPAPTADKPVAPPVEAPAPTEAAPTEPAPTEAAAEPSLVPPAPTAEAPAPVAPAPPAATEAPAPTWTEEGKLVDAQGKQVGPDIAYSEHGEFGSNGLAVVVKGDKYGFIDKTGTEVIPFEYDSARDFSEGLACVGKGDKYGYIDTKGNPIGEGFVYDGAGSFSKGLAWVGKGDKYGYIDTKGNPIGEGIVYDDAGSFSEGLAWVVKGDKRGFIDKQGTPVGAGLIYTRIIEKHGNGFVKKGDAKLSDGTVIKNGEWDETGNFISPTPEPAPVEAPPAATIGVLSLKNDEATFTLEQGSSAKYKIHYGWGNPMNPLVYEEFPVYKEEIKVTASTDNSLIITYKGVTGEVVFNKETKQLEVKDKNNELWKKLNFQVKNGEIFIAKMPGEIDPKKDSLAYINQLKAKYFPKGSLGYYGFSDGDGWTKLRYEGLAKLQIAFTKLTPSQSLLYKTQPVKVVIGTGLGSFGEGLRDDFQPHASLVSKFGTNAIYVDIEEDVENIAADLAEIEDIEGIAIPENLPPVITKGTINPDGTFTGIKTYPGKTGFEQGTFNQNGQLTDGMKQFVDGIPFQKGKFDKNGMLTKGMKTLANGDTQDGEFDQSGLLKSGEWRRVEAGEILKGTFDITGRLTDGTRTYRAKNPIASEPLSITVDENGNLVAE